MTRSARAGKLPKRHSLYEIAVELAPIGILYHPEDISGYLELVEFAGKVGEDYSMDNFKICQVRFALFSLMKMSDSLSKEQRDGLVNLLFVIAPDREISPLVRKEAIVCLAKVLKWRGKISPDELRRAIALFKNDIWADPAEPFRLHVWAEYALGRIMGKLLTLKR